MASKAIGLFTFAFGANMGGFNKALNKAQKNLSKFSRNAQRTGKSLTTSLTLPLAGIGIGATKVFMDFEQAMLKVKAVADATDKDFQMLTDTAQRLGASTSFSASEVASLQLELSKLGFTAKEVDASSEGVLRLAQATGVELGFAAETTAVAMNAFNLEASESGRVADILAKASSSAAVDMEKLNSMLPNVASVAKASGESLEGLTSKIMALADKTGMEGGKLGTHMKIIFKSLAESGMTFEEAMSKIRNATDKNSVAMELFGGNAFGSAIALSEVTDEAAEYEQQLINSGGAALEMANIMDSGLAGAMRRLKSQTEGAAIQLGEVLAPVVEKLAAFVGGLMNKFSELSATTKKIIVVFGIVLASIGPLLIIIAKLALVVISVISGVKALIFVVKLLIPVLTALFRIMLMNPFGLIVTGLAAVVLAFRYVTKSGDNLAVNIRNAFRAVANFAIDGINALIRAGNKVAGVFGKTVDEIEHFAMEGYRSSASTSDVADNVDDLSNSLENLDENLIDTTDDIEDLDDTIDDLGGTTDKTTDKLKKLENISLNLKTDNLVPDISSGPTSAVGEMFSIPESVESDWDVFMNHLEFSFAKLGENLETIWEDVMGGFKSSLNSFTEFFGAQSNKQMTIFKNDKQAQLEALEEQQEAERQALEDTIVDEEELNKALKALDLIHVEDKKAMNNDLDENEKKIKTKQAKREKAIGILNATISGVEAVMATIAMAPPTGLPWSAMVMAAAAANVATIASTPIPAFAQGGLITGATLGLIGEGIGTTAANPEVVAPLDKLKQFMGGDRIEVVGRLVGNDIYLSNKKTEFNRLRTT